MARSKKGGSTGGAIVIVVLGLLLAIPGGLWIAIAVSVGLGMLLYFALKPKTKQPVATPRPSSPPRSAASATPKPGVSTSQAAPAIGRASCRERGCKNG